VTFKIDIFDASLYNIMTSYALNRRRFLGHTAMTTAAAYGLTTFSLSSCQKDKSSTEAMQKSYYEAIVIGSGFGGSAASLRLAERGIDTLLIEKGKFYDVGDGNGSVFSPNIPPDERSTWLKPKSSLPFGINLTWGKKYVGVLDCYTAPNMRAYRNICLGGGSISGGGVLLAPSKEQFRSYISNTIDVNTLYDNFIPKVYGMFAAEQMPEDLFNSSYYKYAQVTKLHALNAGLGYTHCRSYYDFDIWRKEFNGEVQKSALNGELLYGNNNGIKKSLDRNYLAQGLATGKLTIKTLSSVEKIQKKDKLYELQVEEIDTAGNVIQVYAYTAKYVFICAGSIGTSSLLTKCRDNGSLPDLNSEVGRGWGTNGMAFSMRHKLKEATGKMHCAPPTLSVLYPNNPISPVNAMQDIFPIGIDIKTLLMVGQPYVEDRGHWQYDSNTDSAQLVWEESFGEQGVLAMQKLIERLNEVNGGELDHTWIKEGISKSYTYHPLGGMCYDKATDTIGRVKGYERLYVMDGSNLPGNSGMVNPSLLITALAEMNIQTILNEDF
jgi:cholesterol oxidase